MATPNKLFKAFSMFAGLDLRVSDLLRKSDASTGMLNMTYRQTGALSKRKGYQIATEDEGAYGLHTFKNVNTTSGAITEELLTINSNLFKLNEYSFTITYSGSNTIGVYYSLYLNSIDNKFYFDIYDNNVRVLNLDLGTGLEGSPVSVNTLISSISAVTDFSAGAATGGGTSPAAFISIANESSLLSPATLTFKNWSQATTPNGYSSPFNTFYGQRTVEGFENATFAQTNKVLLIATGHDVLHKYDGNRVYKAGLPQAEMSSVADSAGGTTFTAGEKRDFKIQYEYVDPKSNLVNGLTSSVISHTMIGTKDMDIVVNNMQDSEGYNTDQATVNGTQVGVNTITVTSGHNIVAGDYVYITDGVTSSVVSKKVSSVTTTTIVVEGDAVNVTNAEIISNMKIAIYRTYDYSASGVPGTYYVAKELTNDTGNATQTFTDSTTDINMGAEFIDPIKLPGLPPSCKYIDFWRGHIILSGDITSVDTVYYSDIDKPESFDPNSSFIVDSKVTGVKALDNVIYVFQEEEIDAVIGDLVDDNFKVDKLSREKIGCVANNTIQTIKSRLFFLSKEGVYAISSEGLEEIGFPIKPKFKKGNSFTNKQAIAFNWAQENQYVLYLPVASTDPSHSDDASSEIVVYDQFREAWLEWDNLNLMGGMAELDDEIYLCRRTSTNTNLQKVLQTSTKYDYADHQNAISFNYKTHWETLGEPSVFKKFLRCKIHSYDTTVNDFENDTFSVVVKTENDYKINVLTNIVYDFAGGAKGWGLGAWGTFPWGEQRLTQLKKKLASKKARSMRITFENSNLHENVLISGYELEITTPYRLALKE